MVTPTFSISLNFFPKSLGIIDTEGKKNNNNDNLLDYGSQLQAGLVQHRHTHNKI